MSCSLLSYLLAGYLLTGYRICGVVAGSKYGKYALAPSVLHLQHSVSRYVTCEAYLRFRNSSWGVSSYLAGMVCLGLCCTSEVYSACAVSGCHAGILNGQYGHLTVECSKCHAYAVPEQSAVPCEGAGPLMQIPRMCLSCHPGVKPGPEDVAHAPVAKGECLACHVPHASGSRWLLRKKFPGGPYSAWSDKSYELCFSCHRREMLMFSDTSYATGFRAGQRNLHYLHVRGSARGRSCVVCHDAHFNRGSYLVRDYFNFGAWQMPLGFLKGPDGGSCAPGCHRARSYHRQSGNPMGKGPAELSGQ